MTDQQIEKLCVAMGIEKHDWAKNSSWNPRENIDDAWDVVEALARKKMSFKLYDKLPTLLEMIRLPKAEVARLLSEAAIEATGGKR